MSLDIEELLKKVEGKMEEERSKKGGGGETSDRRMQPLADSVSMRNFLD